MKIRLLALIATALTGLQTWAQESIKLPLPSHVQIPIFTRTDRALVSCGPDTIRYPYYKELVFAAPNDSFFVDAMVGNVRTASQAYHISDTVRVHGVQFWGGAYTTSLAPQSLLARVYLYAVDNLNMPIAVLDSADVTITEQYDFYEAMFSTPYTYNQNFAVGVRSVVNDTIAILTNNANNAWTPNYGESLAWRRFGSGAWNSSLSFFGQDLEYMIFPIVSYNIEANFTNNVVCQGGTSVFTNTSYGIFGNRMLNLHAFDAYWGLGNNNSFVWNYGDGAATDTSLNGNHLYASGGNYQATLTGEMLGYYSTCVSTSQQAINIGQGYNTSTSAIICNGGTYQLGTQTLNSAGVYTESFTSASGCDSTVTLTLTEEQLDMSVTIAPGMLIANQLGGNIYQWINCDNNQIIGYNRWFYILNNGNYAVIITKDGCKDTSDCIQITTASVDDNTLNGYEISLYPNPFQVHIQVDGHGMIPDLVTVTDASGRVVQTVKPTSTITSLDMADLSRAMYFVKVSSGDSGKTFKVLKQ